MIGVEVGPATTPTTGEAIVATGQDLQNQVNISKFPWRQNDSGMIFIYLQHVLVVALQELGHLLLRLGTSVARSLLNSGEVAANQTQVCLNIFTQ